MNGIITEIRPSTRRPDKASIIVNGKFAMSLSHHQINEAGLVVGSIWDENLAVQIVHHKAIEKAGKTAMSRLNRRPMSRNQLKQKLIDKGYTSDIVVKVLDKLEASGALNDLAYAKALAHELVTYRYAGPALLRLKLRTKGITERIATTVVSEYSQPDTQLEQALRLGTKKLRVLSRYDSPTQKRRLWNALARRGYDHGIIKTVLRKLINERAF